ncbi:reverse transcriptase domain-containing protein [Trichonephila clavipes]|nr:reverse transcriptase domain-containing protein [Trichonephila clavipes]
MFQILLWYPWKGKKEYVPLRTACSQAGRLWQPKPSSLRAQAQLTKTRTETVETFELVKVEPKLLREEKGERERSRPLVEVRVESITGMRHSCPTDLVLFEADIMPLDLRRKLLLSKYFCKLYSYGDYNCTSAYLISWTNRHRLKRDSPFSRMQAMELLDQDIEEHFLKNIFNPQEGLPRVHFKPEMGAHISKIKIHLNIYVN